MSAEDPKLTHVYGMRMARVNITVPDDLLVRARSAGLNVSRLSSAALAEELDRRAKIAELDSYLAELQAEHGRTSDEERAEAAEWVARNMPGLAAGGSAERAAGVA